MDTLLKKIKELFPEKFRENRRLVIIIAVISLLVLFCIISISKAVSLKNEAGVLKQDLKDVAGSFRAMDLPAAKSDIKKLDSDLEHIQEEMDSGFWVFMSKMPVIGKEVKSAGILLVCASEASDSLLGRQRRCLKNIRSAILKVKKVLTTMPYYPIWITVVLQCLSCRKWPTI